MQGLILESYRILGWTTVLYYAVHYYAVHYAVKYKFKLKCDVKTMR